MEPNQPPLPPTNPVPPLPEFSNPQSPPPGQPIPPQQTYYPQSGTFLSPPNSPKKPFSHPAVIVSGIFLAIALLVGIALLVSHMATHSTANQLQPTAPGYGQCGAAENYAQIAIAGGADCDTATTVIQDASKANGKDYTSNGYSCKATKQGSGTQWSSYWDGTFYSYSCANGDKHIAFNWQPAKTGSVAQPATPTTTPTVTVGGPGALQPTPVGGTQCPVSDNYAQVAISGGADCDTAGTVIQAANGSDYTAAGYTCKATKEGSDTQWSSYWDDNFYAYTCANGSKQVAFNWQNPSLSQ